MRKANPKGRARTSVARAQSITQECKGSCAGCTHECSGTNKRKNHPCHPATQRIRSPEDTDKPPSHHHQSRFPVGEEVVTKVILNRTLEIANHGRNLARNTTLSGKAL